MKIQVLTNQQAKHHIPPTRSYWFSIVSSNDTISWMTFDQKIWNGRQKIIHFDHYNSTYTYTRRTHFFNTGHAEEILQEFEKHKESIDELIISCEHGKNRSAGVAIALNDIYDLNQPHLVRNFPEYAKDVHQKLVLYAQNNNLG